MEQSDQVSQAWPSFKYEDRWALQLGSDGSFGLLGYCLFDTATQNWKFFLEIINTLSLWLITMTNYWVNALL